MADGPVAPRRARLGIKGVPGALLRWKPGQDNIDIFPMSWLIDRRRPATRGEVAELAAPEGRKLALRGWSEPPCLTKDRLTEVL